MKVSLQVNIPLMIQKFGSIFRVCSDGMKPIDDRKKILQCFEAFKVYVDNLDAMLGH
jgi:hypothetical protein